MADGWANFFLGQVGASAALAGLVFVGISVNLSKILQYKGLPGRAFEALTMLTAVLVISSLFLVPGQTLRGLGAETTGVGLLVLLTVVTLIVRNVKEIKPEYRTAFMIRTVLAALAVVPWLVAGLLLLLGRASGVYWEVPAVLFSFIVALWNAWVLVIEINR